MSTPKLHRARISALCFPLIPAPIVFHPQLRGFFVLLFWFFVLCTSNKREIAGAAKDVRLLRSPNPFALTHPPGCFHQRLRMWGVGFVASKLAGDLYSVLSAIFAGNDLTRENSTPSILILIGFRAILPGRTPTKSNRI